VFERVVEACIAAGLVGGEGFAVDASLIMADANKQRSIPGSEWKKDRDPQDASRAVKEYLATLIGLISTWKPTASGSGSARCLKPGLQTAPSRPRNGSTRTGICESLWCREIGTKGRKSKCVSC